MPIEVKMAKLSPTMETGQMVKWMVKVGDKVKEGDTLAEIQTDKAVMPLESFDEGVVAQLDVKEGDDIALGQRVLVLAKKGEDVQQIAKQLGGGAAAPAAKAEVSVAVPKDADSPGPRRSPRPPPAATARRKPPRRKRRRPAAGSSQRRWPGRSPRRPRSRSARSRGADPRAG